MRARPATSLGCTLLVVCLAFGGLIGCGPIHATSAIGAAEAAIIQAEEAEAPRLAPYHYWLSRAYLRKAKQVEGHAQFQVSERFADVARSEAEKAALTALERSLKTKIGGGSGRGEFP